MTTETKETTKSSEVQTETVEAAQDPEISRASIEQPPLPEEQDAALSGKEKEKHNDSEEEADEEADKESNEIATTNTDSLSENAQEESKDKGKEKEEPERTASGEVILKGKDDWSAIWSTEANAYYFWNQKSNEVTWTNPFEVPEEAPPLPELNGIDPDLVYLDPSLRYASSSQNPTAPGPVYRAQFNVRTGRFQANSINPEMASEYSRGVRQQEMYYDVEGWKESLGGHGLKRARGLVDDNKQRTNKKPTKKELERYKAQKIERKKRNLGWLLED